MQEQHEDIAVNGSKKTEKTTGGSAVTFEQYRDSDNIMLTTVDIAVPFLHVGFVSG